jgi:hypothetical protein
MRDPPSLQQHVGDLIVVPGKNGFREARTRRPILHGTLDGSTAVDEAQAQ